MQNGVAKDGAGLRIGHGRPGRAGQKAEMDSLPAAPFRLSLLGRVQLEGRDGPIDLPNKKLAGLLAYLACTAPHPQPREKLSGLLWGSHFDAQAKQNLRQALFRLRKVLGQDALAERRRRGLAQRRGGGLRRRPVRGPGPRWRPGALGAAADSIRGRFIDDVTISEEDWNDWLTRERERLQDLALGALIGLGQQELAGGRAEHGADGRPAGSRAQQHARGRAPADRAGAGGHRSQGRGAQALRGPGRAAEARVEHRAGRGNESARRGAAQRQRPRRRPRRGMRAPPSGAPPPALPLPDRPSIAVLPFANMSSDPEQDYFADGIVEDILTAAVARILAVRHRAQFQLRLRGRAVDMKQVGRELGVRYVVEGSVRKAGNRVRVTAQLIEAETGTHIWADRYERDLNDIFALQDEITQKVVARHCAEPARARDPACAGQADRGPARLRFLPARAARDSTARPKTAPGAPKPCCARRSSSIPPIPRRSACWATSLPRARSTAGTRTCCAGWRSCWRWRAARSPPGPRTAPVSPAPRPPSCWSDAASRRAWSWPSARWPSTRIRCSCASAPASPTSIAVKARRRCEHFETGWRMNPHDPKALTFTGMCVAHFFARRFEECIAWGRRAVEEAGGANIARRHVAAALAHLGRTKEAKAEIAEVLKRQPNSSLARSRLSSFRHQWMYDLYLEGLRKAGLPEQ